MYSMCRKLVTTYVYEETWQMLKFGGACDRTRRELGGGGGSRGKDNKKSVFKRIKLFSLGEEKDNSDNLF